jgi:hypothetical protein
MDATLVYSDARFASIIRDGKIISGLNVLDTTRKVELNCSEFMSKKFREYQKLPGPYNNDKQCFCIAAILFQKYAAADSSLDALEDDQELWDEAVKQEFDSSGNVIIQGNLFSYSDARIKTNVETIPNALDKVISLRGVTYNMIKDVEIDPENAPKHLGVIAQEVEAVIPEAVKEENGIKTVAYGNIVGLLIEAIKDLKDQMNK